MRFISIDLENNQPSGSIIQLGAVAWDTDLDTAISTFNIFVEPPEEEVNWDHLLNIGETLEALLGPTFKSEWEKRKVSREEGLKQFWEWVDTVKCGKKVVQWGRGDMEQILKESKLSKVRYPSHLRVLNLKTTYQFLFQPALRYTKVFGLGGAVRSVGLTFEGDPHNALADSLNTARVYAVLYKKLEKYRSIEQLF